MSEQQTAAASSPAVQEDVFAGQQLSMSEYDKYRSTGELPERLKPAEKVEAAPADDPEETEAEGEKPESAGDSETPTDQHQEPRTKPRNATQRIAQLEAAVESEWDKEEPDVIRIAQLKATIEKIRGGVARKTEPAPVTPPPQKQQPTTPEPQYTRPKPKIDDHETYENYVEDLTKWQGEQLLEQYKREQAEQQAIQALRVKVDEARSRYENADAVIFPAAQTINNAQIPPAVKEVVAQSDVFPDLCYVLGEDPEELNKFVSLAQTNPRAALARVFELERGIREELASGKAEATPKAPEKKVTQAPPPPKPVSGGTRGSFDVNDESLPPEVWFKKRNEQLARRK